MTLPTRPLHDRVFVMMEGPIWLAGAVSWDPEEPAKFRDERPRQVWGLRAMMIGGEDS